MIFAIPGFSKLKVVFRNEQNAASQNEREIYHYFTYFIMLHLVSLEKQQLQYTLRDGRGSAKIATELKAIKHFRRHCVL